VRGLPSQPFGEQVGQLLAAIAADRARPQMQDRFSTDVERLAAYIGDPRADLASGNHDRALALCARLVISAALACPLMETTVSAVPIEVWVAQRIDTLIALVRDREQSRRAGLPASEDSFDLDDVAEISDVLRGISEDDLEGRDRYSLVVYVCTEMGAELFRLALIQPVDLAAVLAAHDALTDAAAYLAHLLEHPMVFDPSLSRHPGAALFHLISVAHTLSGPDDVPTFVPPEHKRRAYLWARIGMSAFWCSTMRLPASRPVDSDTLWHRAHGLAAEILASSGATHESVGFDSEKVLERIRGHAYEVVSGWLDTALDKDGPLRRESDVNRLTEVMAYSLIGVRLQDQLKLGTAATRGNPGDSQ
jgi:hypothetical protein